MRKSVFLIVLPLFCAGVFGKAKLTFDKVNAIKDEKPAMEFKSDSAMQTVRDMKTGWNLGNTLDADGRRNTVESEISWGMPRTTKKLIDEIAKSGMKTIRLPVTWSNHIDEKCSVDVEWMLRVKEIVDWAIEDDLYVILNCHHDTAHFPEKKLSVRNGYYPLKKYYKESEQFIVNLWTQISLAFNNGYDEHLIFEVMNEPRLRDTKDEWGFNPKNPECVESADIINKLNQAALNAIRASGGNNEKRFVMIPSYVASPYSALADSFVMPTDVAPDRLILSTHMYTPFNFAGESPGIKNFTPRVQNDLASAFKSLNDKFVANGYPVVIGEYGATNKNNLEDRVEWFHAFIKYSRKYGMTSVLWDNSNWRVQGNDFSERFGYFNRLNYSWYFPELLQAIQEELAAEE